MARLNTYDKVQRRLAVLNWPEGKASAGDDVYGDGKSIGAVTSVAEHPDGEFVGLAYVRRAFKGAEVAIGPSGTIAALKAVDTPD